MVYCSGVYFSSACSGYGLMSMSSMVYALSFAVFCGPSALFGNVVIANDCWL